MSNHPNYLKMITHRVHKYRIESDADRLSRMEENICLFSTSGNLQSLYDPIPDNAERSQGYKDVTIGKPLVIRYLHYYLNFPEAQNRPEEVMISSFVKTAELKKPAAETVNYYDPSFLFKDGKARIEFQGGDKYSHELIYYTKSYTGEPFKLTTKIMELDNSDASIEAITDGIQSVGSIPIFVEYLPYFAIAKTATGVLKRLLKILDRDDPIVPGIDLDMHFQKPHMPQLRSGRVLCVSGDDSTVTKDQLIQDYKLNSKNRLVKKSDGSEYTDSSYYVLQVNQEHHKAFENFEYFQNAAELLALTNRPNPKENLKEFIGTAVEGFKTYSDIQTIEEMEDMRYDLDTPESLQKFKALFKGLSPDVKKLYEAQYRSLLEENK